MAIWRDFSTSDKHYVKNYGLTCIGILTMIVIIFIIISIPVTISMISTQDVLALPSLLLFQALPLTLSLIVLRLLYKRRSDEIPRDELEHELRL